MDGLHTKLTSRSDIALWREIKKQYIRVYVKGILPPGPVTTFVISTDDTVFYLYAQFLNCCGGAADHCGRQMKLVLPVETGVYILDNLDLPEDDMYLGQTTCDRTLSEYNITGTDGSGITKQKMKEVTFFMLPEVNVKTERMIERYFHFNINMDTMPSFKVQYR
jgi:hypothetical protein